MLADQKTQPSEKNNISATRRSTLQHIVLTVVHILDRKQTGLEMAWSQQQRTWIGNLSRQEIHLQELCLADKMVLHDCIISYC